ncbi:Hypothetical Protein FCC1311_043982 [Hondaea fermentalgiana]|uniref:Uncharacterized protein n=1 Tax=Hondaea fermentalgiana TaxID=2315210 RepID=A0A2R5GC95_9STRA|nr:Hypothetical Protein FCC1311_043982 [Hondaea fermentalgiana]|eukprot:GBG28175.1 Hypothetical Protein FCC1311_043982 [Hondaea fermentalgiana]
MAPQEAPSCGGSGAGGGGEQQDSQQQGHPSQQQQQQQQQSQEGEVHDIFGDVNLGAAMLFLMLLHLLKYTMQDPCSC